MEDLQAFQVKVDEAIAQKNGEEAFLLYAGEIVGFDWEGDLERLPELEALGTEWIGVHGPKQSEDLLPFVRLLSSDNNRKRFLVQIRYTADEGAIISRMKEVLWLPYLQILIDVLVEHTDDPAYIDAVLGDTVLPLTEAQKLQLIAAKQKISGH